MYFSPRKQTGFTLVELLTVMLVLVAMASVTIETTSDLAFQNRYEVTKDRYEKIKRAIIGRPDVLINGQPDISGFVADMGRLPRNLHELTVQNYCVPDNRISDNTVEGRPIAYATNEAWCIGEYPGAPVQWLEQSNNLDCSDNVSNNQAACIAAGAIWSGWKGPYLSLKKPDFDPRALPDGWGNVPTDYCTDLNFTTSGACTGAGKTWLTAIQNHNYGWYYFVDQGGPIDQLHLFSLGRDGILGPAAQDYDADYPSSTNHPNETPALSANDWLVPLPQITVAMQAPLQNTPNCKTNGVSENACINTASWEWFGKAECRKDADNTVTITLTTEVDCTTEIEPHTWYWFTAWPIEFCENNTATTEATCIAAPSTWHSSLCSGGSSTGNEKTLQECLGASPSPGTWSREWPVDNARCTNNFFTSQYTCEAAGHRWIIPFCTNPTKLTKATCNSLLNEFWIISLCSDGVSTTEAACIAATESWGGCIDNTSSKTFCTTNGGNWITHTQDIKLEITYIDGANGLLTTTANATVEENGLYQQVVFNNDDQSDGVVFFIDADDDGFEDPGEADVTAIPQGIATFSIFKADTLTNDIYPPSCSGLNAIECAGADDADPDITDPDAVLLNNNLCDNVTALECTNAGGRILRSQKDMIFLPNSTVPTINW